MTKTKAKKRDPFAGMTKVRVSLVGELGSSLGTVVGYTNRRADHLAVTECLHEPGRYMVTARSCGFTACAGKSRTAREAIVLRRKLEPLADWPKLYALIVS